ncbi:MAG TPA: hypothetical protein VNO75_05595 [Gemmatimonadaceae bacterium]|nr:hypothetical protein [Gemmatimonadaceae bacterium]
MSTGKRFAALAALALALYPSGAAAQRVMTNAAVATFRTPVGVDTARSQTTQTVILLPQLSVEKFLDGAATAEIGDLITYRIRYGNASPDGAASEVSVVDSLPAGLEFVSSPVASQANGREITWTIGNVPFGTAAEIPVTVRVSDGLRDTVRVRNRVLLFSRDLAPLEAFAPEVALIGVPAGSLAIRMNAEVLEVGMGEAAPFKIVLENIGSSPVATLNIRVRLPAGTSLVPGSASGVDSVRSVGSEVTLYLPGSLTGATSRTVRFALALVSTNSSTLAVSARAHGDLDAIESANATASVKVSRSSPMATRTGFGKVWVDLDGDRRQSRGEPGIAGVSIWTDDGDVATTDAAGRFSFRDLRAGSHTFRLDPLTLPADLRVAGNGSAADVAVRTATGWTTPRVDFRLLPQGGTLSGVQLSNADSTAALPAVGADSNGRMSKLPVAARLPRGTSAAITLAAPATGWPGAAVFSLEPGWSVISGSATLGGSTLPDPEVRRDRSGANVLQWKVPPSDKPISVSLRPGSDPVAVDTVSIPELRNVAERAADARSALTMGPGVAIFAPLDGTVFKSDRIFVGVRGEPGKDVALFDGDSLVANGTLRADGVHDFIAVRVSAGPHRLRATITNSWGQARWDSVAIHVSGLPASFASERDVVHLVADGQTIDSVRVRVLDGWKVPVSNGAMITVRAEGASPTGVDVDPSSVGTQLRTDPAGYITVALKPGRDVRRGNLFLASGDSRAEVPLEMLPAARALMVTGSGQVGIGAAPGAFGSLSAVGHLDDRTAITLNYDSRRVNAGTDVFGRSSDPLDPAQYPLLGDAGVVRTENSSRYSLAARIERGFDWITLGDVTTSDFASGLQLAGYRRALPGAAGRYTAGPLTLQAFGSSTNQTVRQEQIRGQGISGPYQLASGVVPGTELVAIETRALENAQRLVSRQSLVRFVDYEIDYDRGTLLFKRPLPASDTYGNPVFIVVTLESAGDGPQASVWGVRATGDVSRLMRLPMLDSALVGALWVQDNRIDGAQTLSGTDIRLISRSGLTLGAEFSQSHAPDSSGVAGALHSSLNLFNEAVKLRASWMRIGDGFANPANLGLRSGSSELTFGARGLLGRTEFKLEHQQQEFAAENVSRERTLGSIVQPLRSDLKVETSLVNDSYHTLSTADASQAGEIKLSWATSKALTLWSDARRQFSRQGNAGQPDYVGVGAEYRITPQISLEARHRQVALSGDTAGFSITNVGLRANVGANTEAWGSYQMAGVAGSHNAAIMGLNNKLQLGNGWTLNGLLERRQGVGNASIADPVRALPFLQQEENYSAAALGVELLPTGARYRMSTRGEYRDGDLRSVRMLEFAGDVSLDSSLAVLGKGGILRTTQQIPGEAALSRRGGTLLGLAFRPAHTNDLNVLAKVEYVDALNPIGGGVLAVRGQEQRIIGALEGIWAPVPVVELGARFATRRTSATPVYADSSTMSLRSSGDYMGARASLQLGARLTARVESRLLIEHTSGISRADAAPQLALTLGALETTLGYRFGDLRDPDFAVMGGHGAFLSVSAAITENSARTVADFWRARLGNR